MKLSKEQFREILGKQVGDELSYQTSKPFDKIDWEIVEMCEHVLEILFPENGLTDEEIAERIQAVKECRSLRGKNIQEEYYERNRN